MINKITMNNVSCYKNQTVLKTDKKVNLIYGLNGTGKSTVSDFLYNQSDKRFIDCSIEGLKDSGILVYNQQFIQEYFYASEDLEGIFTVSKENKQAIEAIEKAKSEIERLKECSLKTEKDKDEKLKRLEDIEETAHNATWSIKSNYTGGDRILEFCLEGLKREKAKLFQHIKSIAKPESKPQKTIDQLKKEAEAISGDDAQRYDLLPTMGPEALYIEGNTLFSKTIVGNENSTVAELIKSLGNSDWVKEGLRYISNDKEETGICPFCQNKTITEDLRDSIRAYFNESYENDLNELKNLWVRYRSTIENLPKREVYQDNPFITENRQEFENLYTALHHSLTSNSRKIESKIKSPSQLIQLSDSSQLITDFNTFIIKINETITSYNTKLNDKKGTQRTIKDEFWMIMRWEYDQTISSYLENYESIQRKVKDINDEEKKITGDVNVQKQIIETQQKNTINIEEAREKINSGLQELGIDEFRIEKHTDSQYKIARNEQCENTFSSLSEGEKMIISFLYFRELCKGASRDSSKTGKKIIVIDDPISSLSHVFIFNIGQMIKYDFLDSKEYEQVFLLTHNLYFFHEMIKQVKAKDRLLFKLSKNRQGSNFSVISKEDIQNDYQAYWSVVKAKDQHGALIANCMRNIIEYFFGFIEKEDLDSVFKKPVLREKKYQAFYRYINRESHSDGVNIYDFTEFDYDLFKEAFRLVFYESGYEEHYNKMMR